MKNFILKFGRILIDIAIILEILIMLALSIIAGIAIGDNASEGLGLFAGILIFICLMICVVFSNFILYHFLGVADSFDSIAESLKIIVKSQNTKLETKTTLVCSKCGAEYSTGEQFCGECGNKLN